MNGKIALRAGFSLLLIGLVLLSACNMPGRNTPAPSEFELINTAAARTVAAQLTEISRPPAATPEPTQKSPLVTATSASPALPTALPSQAPVFTLVPQPTQAPQASACDRSKFIKDVTIPDNTALQPGERFTKTWRLQNIGQCTWEEDYSLVFTGGELLGALPQVLLPKVVRPDATVDISVEMIAPTQGGTYRSEWKLSNADGQVFGGGRNGDLPVWAQIIVEAPGGESGARQFDFVSSASSAAWYSAAGDNSGLPLAFGGPLDSPQGAAVLADGLRLENGQTSGKILLMTPKPEDEGYVYGVFPLYQVKAGDHFKARVGFAANPDGKCGQGKVIFQIAVKDGEDIDTLQEIPAACDGTLTPVDLSLSELRGQTLAFILVVKADGSAQDDWAVWNSPQITQP